RLLALAADAERVGAAPLSLDGPARPDRGAHRLDLQRALPRHLRAADLPREPRLRVLDDELRRSARRLRPPPLPGHLRLGVRPGLAARELLRSAQPDRCLLLRLLPLRPEQER